MEEVALGVKGVVVRDGKVLILIKPDGAPDLPGGRIENGESLVHGLHREIQEETGLKVRVLRPVSQWSFTKKPEMRVTGMTYQCQCLGGNLKLSPEHSGHRWVTPTELGVLDFKRPYLTRRQPD